MCASASGQADEALVVRGERAEVWYATRANGNREAQQWLESESHKIRAQFDFLFRKIGDEGRIFNKEQFRNLGEGIFEFKRGPHRVLCFRQENRFYLTHHFQKKGRKCPRKQIDRAMRIRAEALQENH